MIQTEQVANADSPGVKVWDRFVRTFHWSVFGCFFVAYFTEDEALTLHVWAGYSIAGFLILRLAWGLVGPRHARFADFVYRPSAVVSYMRDLLGFRARRYLGHSPAGGAMVVALMVFLAATVWTGLELYAVEENAGPLASASTTSAVSSHPILPALVSTAEASEDEGEQEHEQGGEDGVWEVLHEVAANTTLMLVLLHIAGVIFASVVHHENLVRAMWTGRKRPE